MTAGLVTLHPDMDIVDAVDLLLSERISGAAVVEDGQLVGILTERDCLRTVAVGHADPQGASVRHYMSKIVETIEPELDLITIAGRFLDAPYRWFPVVDSEGRLVGQVSRYDALHGAQQLRATRTAGPDDRAKSPPR